VRAAPRSYGVRLERSSVLELPRHSEVSRRQPWRSWARERAEQGPIAVDLFSGAGGLGLGLERAGYTVVVPAGRGERWPSATARPYDQTAGSPGSRSRIRMRSGMGRSWSTLDVSRFELLCRDDRPNCRPGRRRRSLNACPTLRVILNQHPSPLLRSRQRRQRPASSTEMSLSFGKPHRRRTLARSDLTHPDARVGVASSHSQLAANWRGGGRLVRR
jgi:hypothetical protein